MHQLIQLLKRHANNPLFGILFLFICTGLLYYQFFLKLYQPFPADLLVGSYIPWLDYYKMPVKNPLISDIFSQLYLWKYLAVETYKIGQFPLWNPYSFAGTPLLANFQSATLYPLNILLFLPKNIGWGLFIFSQTLLCALSMYLLLRQLTKYPLAQIIGSVIFALGGLMTTWVELGTAVHAMIWLPLCIYAVIKFNETTRIRFLILLSILYPISIFAGNVQISLYTFVSVTLLSLIFSFKNAKGKKLFFYILLFQLFGLSLASIQLIPSFSFLQTSIRGADNFIQQDNFGLLPIYEIIKMFNADFFGNPTTRNYYGFLNYFETSLYLGGLSLPFILFFFKNNLYSIRKVNNSKINLFVLILFIASVIISFSNPISQLLYQYKIPLLTQSYASRGLFLFVFSSALLIALAFDQLLRFKDFKALLRSTVYSSAIVIGIFLGILISNYIFYSNLPKLDNPTVLTEFFIWDIRAASLDGKVAFRNTLIPLSLNLFLLLSILTIFSLKRIKPKVNQNLLFQLLSVVIVVFWCADLSRYFLKFNPFTPPELLYPETSSITFVKEQNEKEVFRITREHGEVLPPNTWMAFKLSSLDGYDPLHSTQISDYISFLNNGHFKNRNASRFAEIGSRYDSAYLDISNVKYIFGILRTKDGRIGDGDQINELFKKFPIAFQDKSSVIFENPNYLPRFYFAKKVVHLSEEETKQKFSDPTFDPKTTTLLSNVKSLLPETSGEGEIKLNSYSPNKIELTTKTENPEILITSDQYDTGWNVNIDNKKTPLLKANLVFRGIEVPRGEHTITLTYQPKSFFYGSLISLISLFSLLCIAIFAWRKNRF